MKYSEFKAEVEKLGLHLWVYEFHIDVVDKKTAIQLVVLQKMLK